MTRDIDAVRAAIASNWSNGQTEGQITKLKLVKRQMYGRARGQAHSGRNMTSVKIASEPNINMFEFHDSYSSYTYRPRRAMGGKSTPGGPTKRWAASEGPKRM